MTMADDGVPHLTFASTRGNHLFVAAYGRLFDLPVGATLDPGDPDHQALLARLAKPGPDDDDLGLRPTVAPQSISLNVSASCNLACGYCYAGQGGFEGRQPSSMDWPTAKDAIDRLLDGAERTSPITVGFIGGEPFMNRALIHQVTGYAATEAAVRALDVRFSVTTNATLLRDEDRDLLRRHPFAVTVSLDGDAVTHDRHRPTRGGRGSWSQAIGAIAPLLAEPGHARVAARATVAREDMDVSRLFNALVEAGFTEIGFSPLRDGHGSSGGLQSTDWPVYLSSFERLATAELARATTGEPVRLTNLAVALKQIHRGAASPYPCGAGGGYFSVGGDGAWYACHRAVGDPAFRLGDNTGLDTEARAMFLDTRHVDRETDCRGCWARYLCSGGCHHERSARTPASCDFIRGWLRFCLTAYCESGPPAAAPREPVDA